MDILERQLSQDFTGLQKTACWTRLKLHVFYFNLVKISYWTHTICIKIFHRAPFILVCFRCSVNGAYEEGVHRMFSFWEVTIQSWTDNDDSYTIFLEIEKKHTPLFNKEMLKHENISEISAKKILAAAYNRLCYCENYIDLFKYP